MKSVSTFTDSGTHPNADPPSDPVISTRLMLPESKTICISDGLWETITFPDASVYPVCPTLDTVTPLYRFLCKIESSTTAPTDTFVLAGKNSLTDLKSIESKYLTNLRIAAGDLKDPSYSCRRLFRNKSKALL